MPTSNWVRPPPRTHETARSLPQRPACPPDLGISYCLLRDVHMLSPKGATC